LARTDLKKVDWKKTGRNDSYLPASTGWQVDLKKGTGALKCESRRGNSKRKGNRAKHNTEEEKDSLASARDKRRGTKK